MENLYKHLREGFFTFMAVILKIPSIKFIQKGMNKDVIKLIIESLIRWI